MKGGAFWLVGVDLAIPTLQQKARWGFTLAYEGNLGDTSLAQLFMLSVTTWVM